MEAIWKIQSVISAATPEKRRRQIIKNLLFNRGLTTRSQQHQFLHPLEPSTISPVRTGIKKNQLTKAVQRIKEAIQAEDLIYIYGDYDADGISATAILWETLHHLGANVMPYIPSREGQGRGLSPAGIDELLPQEPSLIITVDNGITSFKACLYAQKQGVEVIISDHHQPKHKNNQPVYPQALAIIHSLKLSGAGVAWFLSQAVLKEFSSRHQTLDLVALGTIADLVPLTEFNRALTKYGLQVLRQSQRPGLKALAKTAEVELTQLTTHEVSFRLAPRLNALGRLEHALDSLRLLCTPNPERARQLAAHLHQTNQLRQNLTESMFRSACRKAAKQKKQKLIFVQDKTYHEGVVGLVAGKLVEKFHRPAVVVAQGKTQAKASARSLPGFNLIKSFRTIEKLFLELGGHQLAAGFSAENKKLSLIKKKLQALANKQLSSAQLQPELVIDCQVELKDINWELFKELEKLQPFGFANPRPIFVTPDVRFKSYRQLGPKQQHLKLKLENFEAIGFNLGHLAEELSLNQTLDIAYTLEENIWNGQKSLQLKLKDIRNGGFLQA